MLCVYITIFIRSTRVSSLYWKTASSSGYSLANVNDFIGFSESEGELSLSAGDYILVWGSGEPQGGYFDAELLDGRRGLVPASYVQRLIGKS